LNRLRALALTLLSFVALPAAANADTPSTSGAGTGGAVYEPAQPAQSAPMVTPGSLAKLLPDGTAAAPALAPPQIQQAIWAANTIQRKPYIYGGGHRSFKSRGYDCSGTVSFALHAAGLLTSPLDSSSFMTWGARGRGHWMTVYTNPGHAYAVIAGLRLDTSSAGVSSARYGAKATQSGPRWRPTGRSARGYRLRHPVGF
jgi:hypothetical protein